MQAAHASAPPVITGEQVTKIYRKGDLEVHALRGVDVEIDRASFVSFVGPSGSGKTTLLNLIGALDSATEGCLTVLGRGVRRRNACRSSRLRCS